MGNGRVMECYYTDMSVPRVVGAVSFTPLTEGSEGNAGSGAIAACFDESFVWWQIATTEFVRDARASGTAWLDVNLYKDVPLNQTFKVTVSLERLETKDVNRFKIYCKAQL